MKSLNQLIHVNTNNNFYYFRLYFIVIGKDIIILIYNAYVIRKVNNGILWPATVTIANTVDSDAHHNNVYALLCMECIVQEFLSGGLKVNLMCAGQNSNVKNKAGRW